MTLLFVSDYGDRKPRREEVSLEHFSKNFEELNEEEANIVREYLRVFG